MEGQVFLVPLPADFGSGEPQVKVPTGRWKDGTFDFCNAGPCHPSLWCALCFTQGEIFSIFFILISLLSSISDFIVQFPEFSWNGTNYAEDEIELVGRYWS